MSHNYLQVLAPTNRMGTVYHNEPLAPRTTYRIGGPADILVEPRTARQVARIFKRLHKTATPFFILGGGANILISDLGIRGVVIATTRLNAYRVTGATITCGAGLAISEAAERSAARGLGGLHHFYAMPGSVGGALWMNARCYGKSIDQLLAHAEYVDGQGAIRRYTPTPRDFDYKRSPFQDPAITRCITAITFHAEHADPKQLRASMDMYKKDRESKGHFSAPSAGSVFKNNRAFGKPSGVIIDSAGLRGRAIGDAKISEQHANIFINTGQARATDMRALITYTRNEINRRYNIDLEQEIHYVGQWDEHEQ